MNQGLKEAKEPCRVCFLSVNSVQSLSSILSQKFRQFVSAEWIQCDPDSPKAAGADGDEGGLNPGFRPHLSDTELHSDCLSVVMQIIF